MTKEAILNSVIQEHPFQGFEEEQEKISLLAMDQYAKQEVIEALESLLISLGNAHPEYAQEIIREQISIHKHGI